MEMTANQFACRPGSIRAGYQETALSMATRCDGRRDCESGSDEWQCRKLTTFTTCQQWKAVKL